MELIDGPTLAERLSAADPAQAGRHDGGNCRDSVCYHGHESMVMSKKKSPRLVRESTAPSETDTRDAVGFSRKVPAGEFKARCLAFMDEVRDRGGEYVITKRGAPVAKLVPVRMERRPLLGSMKGTVKVRGDIVSPLDEPWEALEGGDDDR